MAYTFTYRDETDNPLSGCQYWFLAQTEQTDEQWWIEQDNEKEYRLVSGSDIDWSFKDNLSGCTCCYDIVDNLHDAKAKLIAYYESENKERKNG